MGLHRVGHDWSNLAAAAAAAAAAALGSNRFHVPLFLNNLPIPSLFSQWHALCSAYNLSLAISCLLLTYSQTSHFLFGHLFPVLRTIIILVVYYNTELLSSASECQRSKLGLAELCSSEGSSGEALAFSNLLRLPVFLGSWPASLWLCVPAHLSSDSPRLPLSKNPMIILDQPR